MLLTVLLLSTVIVTVLSSRLILSNQTDIANQAGSIELEQHQNLDQSKSLKTTLRSLAQAQGIQVGAAVLMEPFREDANYRTILTREFNLLVPENAMKWRILHPERHRYDFTDADALVTFAKTNQMQVQGHTLVWHQSLPSWLAEAEWTREEVLELMRQHIYTVVGHYRGQVESWDVVNEAISHNGKMRDSVFLNGIGPEYIEMAFRWAHEADPQARLFYNDHDAEELGKKSDAIYELVKNLLKRNVPIHGVGFQMHTSLKRPPNPQKVAANIQRLGELGLEVWITEMDVQIYDGKGTREEKLAAQAEVYRDILRVCLDAPNCKSFATWGFSDKYSWIPYFFDRPDSPLIFDESYRPKPAYNALVEELQGASQ
ncbi:MAG: endo-1,4-beta-xylanase [Symploca sp. SIO1B1]|nr:endo-1,4-beta-xylanase [Symploca sp. SIO1B1]